MIRVMLWPIKSDDKLLLVPGNAEYNAASSRQLDER